MESVLIMVKTLPLSIRAAMIVPSGKTAFFQKPGSHKCGKESTLA